MLNTSLWLVVGFALLLFAFPQSTYAVTIFLTSGSSWTVPANWNNSNNSIEVIGGGGGGYPEMSGGGGAYSKITNKALTPGSVVSYSVGAGGMGGQMYDMYTNPNDDHYPTDGGDTWFVNTATVMAKGGQAYGAGGAASAGVGTVKYSGGTGGGLATDMDDGDFSGGGGGGAAGPHGPGGAGGNAIGPYGGNGGGGGGGSAGHVGAYCAGTVTRWYRYTCSGTIVRDTQAGNNWQGVGGGTNGAAGVNGGGGSSGPTSPAVGGNGGNGSDWDATHGAGGGGGAGISGSWNRRGGDGGLYGGGGGGGSDDSYYNGYSGWGGNGAQGIIVIIYTPANAAPAFPTITGPSSLLLNTAGTFSFVSTDSNGDTLRYAIDWDNNGTIDEYLPASGYVSSGTSRSVTHSWSSAGTKTFQARAQDSQGASSAWTSKSVTITNPAPTVLFTSNADTYTPTGSPVTLTWSSTYATSCTGTNFSTGGATSGSVQVTPPQTTTYTVSCTGAGGTTDASKTITYVCAPTNICSGLNVTNSCTGAIVNSCSYQCGAGACVPPPAPGFSSFSATDGNGIAFTASGHLQARPSLVRPGDTARLYWNVSNVSSCTTTGTNGDSWIGGASGTGGKTTAPISEQTTYTLHCTGLDSSTVTETATVRLAPVFREL